MGEHCDEELIPAFNAAMQDTTTARRLRGMTTATAEELFDVLTETFSPLVRAQAVNEFAVLDQMFLPMLFTAWRRSQDLGVPFKLVSPKPLDITGTARDKRVTMGVVFTEAGGIEFRIVHVHNHHPSWMTAGSDQLAAV